MEFIVVYLAMLFIYVVVDFIWITFFMQPYFTANLGHLLRHAVYLCYRRFRMDHIVYATLLHC